MEILTNINIATPISGNKQGTLLEINDAAIAWESGVIKWVGSKKSIPSEYSKASQHDGQGLLAIPGLIDCHTHLCFAGWRTDEFKKKILGTPYIEIAKAGGGILSTVKQTRLASKHELVTRCEGFLGEITKLGVTTVEAKSGYGLSVADEIKTLEVYQELNSKTHISVIPTFLGAHTIPEEYKANRQDYISLIVELMLPEISKRKLAHFCDIFVEDSAFTAEEARLILSKACSLGLPSKLHVDQLTANRGAELAAELNAVSADHLEHTTDEGIKALAQKNVIAVSLPIASIYTKQPPLNGRRFIESGVELAIATDFNPGSAPTFNLQLAMWLGCTLNRLTPHETLDAVTRIAAKALKLDGEIGTLEIGKRADFALLNIKDFEHWMYHFTGNVCQKVYKNGQAIQG